MKRVQIIKNFILTVSKQLSMNLNYMDDKGIIRASSVPERIGTFHQGAYHMLQNKKHLLVTDGDGKDLLGVIPPGVNFLLFDGREAFGVLGCSGDPRQVLPIGKVIKTSIEMLIQNENAKHNVEETALKDDNFTNAILFDTPLNYQRISKLMRQNNFDMSCPRVSVVVSSEEHQGAAVHMLINDLYKSMHSAKTNDMLLYIHQWRSLILKEIPLERFLSYKEYVTNYISELMEALSKKADFLSAPIIFYCGLPQTSMFKCRQMYAALDWLTRHNEHTNQSRIVHLRDYLLEYSVECMDRNISVAMFEATCEKMMAESDINMFVDTIGAFIESGFNLELTAKMLFVHRNTVVQRIQKIQKIFGATPRSNIKDAIFLITLYNLILDKRTRA